MKIGVDLLTIGNNYSGNKLTTPKTEKPHTKEMNTKDKKNNTGNAGNRGQSKTSSHMPTSMDSSYTAASSEETVPLKDMAYNRKKSVTFY